ncbi:hypothetical protein STVIR_5387 [Streptomyces viridochromogenes Tue57]|uniref:Uncharacterized protein n=1 Tax=Streptomyces viridochromogenes Tue57 TaxID=1160705 RepID=L8P7S4_STRVR|nr:hypothetical protein STVIR_5387 [Streptomyces viridochromogenes Tue57]
MAPSSNRQWLWACWCCSGHDEPGPSGAWSSGRGDPAGGRVAQS